MPATELPPPTLEAEQRVGDQAGEDDPPRRAVGAEALQAVLRIVRVERHDKKDRVDQPGAEPGEGEDPRIREDKANPNSTNAAT